MKKAGNQQWRILVSVVAMAALLIGVTSAVSCGATGVFKTHKAAAPNTNGYGAFLGIDAEKSALLTGYDKVSIDAQYFSDEDIAAVKAAGTEVYSYLNVGSLEDFRDYYDDYKELTFLDYDNWPEERWIDVSAESWQDFILKELVPEIKDKGVDGVYLDNADVYTIAKEHYGEKAANVAGFYRGLRTIIQGINDAGLKVMMNGGSEFLLEAIEAKDPVVSAIYAYHQEEVFSVIEDYDENIFGRQDSETSQFYKEVIQAADAAGLEIFLLEYTCDTKLIREVMDYCKKQGYNYYCARRVELT